MKCIKRLAPFFFILAGCALRPPARPPSAQAPIIRVGIAWGLDSMIISMASHFEIASHDGAFIARGQEGTRWRAEVKETRPGQKVYALVAASMSTVENAEKFANNLQKKGFETFVQPIGRELRMAGRSVNDSRMYRVYLKKGFETEDAAREYKEEIRDRLETFITNLPIRESLGTIILTNVDNGQMFESTKAIHIRGSPVTLEGVPVGVGYHWETSEIRTYPAAIALQLDAEGKLAIINILSLEEYLMGVVPSEMPKGFPMEALKAQAVAARGEVLSKWGRVHRNDPFDICADVHCQAYSGLSKRARTTDNAVTETRGMVLWKDNAICDAVYSSVCGGHGESVENAWGGSPKSFLEGRYDGSGLGRYGDLTKENKVKRWIESNPQTFCNTTRGRLPEALDYTQKYFRWEVRYAQNELKEIIRKKTGRDIGDILNIKPLVRGVSGRIIKLDIMGSRGDIRIERELEIRKTLSDNTLWSACFFVETRGRRFGAPETFIIKGAGWGHGVGMCQTGAAGMALKGARFDKILKHYYQGVEIRRIY